MIRGIWALTVVVVLTVVLAVPAMVGSLLFRESDVCLRLAKLWSRLILGALGIRPEYAGLENMARHLPCIYISNHLSLVDIPVLLYILPNSVRFVAKESLFRIPFMGWAMSASGFIPIDRRNRAKAIRSLELAAGKIRAGRPVLLFAEGTRSRSGCLAPFKKGGFHLALKAGVPVVPVAVTGTYSVLRPRSARITPGPVRVWFDPPLAVDPFLPEDITGLLNAVRGAIESHLEAARQSPPPGEPRVATATERSPL